MDGLGWILKIFKQTHQKRQEARVDLRGDEALDQYFIGLMVSGLWPLAETFDSPYNASNMHVCVVGVPQN